MPSMDPRRRTLRAPLSGDPPNPIRPPSGCRFRTRCPFAEKVCEVVPPSAAWRVEKSGAVACHMRVRRLGPQPCRQGGERMTECRQGTRRQRSSISACASSGAMRRWPPSTTSASAWKPVRCSPSWVSRARARASHCAPCCACCRRAHPHRRTHPRSRPRHDERWTRPALRQVRGTQGRHDLPGADDRARSGVHASACRLPKPSCDMRAYPTMLPTGGRWSFWIWCRSLGGAAPQVLPARAVRAACGSGP